MSNVVHLHDFKPRAKPVTIMIQEVSGGKTPTFEVQSYYFGKTKIKLNNAPEKILKYLNNLKSYVIVVNESLHSSELCEALEDANFQYSEVHDDLFQGLIEGKFEAALEHMSP